MRDSFLIFKEDESGEEHCHRSNATTTKLKIVRDSWLCQRVLLLLVVVIFFAVVVSYRLKLRHHKNGQFTLMKKLSNFYQANIGYL